MDEAGERRRGGGGCGRPGRSWQDLGRQAAGDERILAGQRRVDGERVGEPWQGGTGVVGGPAGSTSPAGGADMSTTTHAGVPTSTRATDRLKMAHDASHYLLVPESVATPRTAADVAALFRASQESRVPLTFRSGGTSLSGQGVTAGVLADTRAAFRAVHVLDGGARVRVQPGATVRTVNAHLARHGRKLGPDPASEIACTIGGGVGNNSTGVAGGTEHNTHRTPPPPPPLPPSPTAAPSPAAD